jgi:hypothetical protein
MISYWYKENALFFSLCDFKETCYLLDYTHENDRELNNFNCVKIAQFCIDFWGTNNGATEFTRTEPKIRSPPNTPAQDKWWRKWFFPRSSQLHLLVPSVNIASEWGRGKITTWTAKYTVYRRHGIVAMEWVRHVLT